MLKVNTFFGQGIDVGRLDSGSAQHGQIRAHIIREDEDDIELRTGYHRGSK